MKPYWNLVAFILVCGFLVLLPGANGQEEFAVPIVCYECQDLAVNTSCAEAENLTELNTTLCEKGGCIKLTYYSQYTLIMRRTCSENLPINIQLTNDCRTERYGNGYMCMCSQKLCNSATRRQPEKLMNALAAVTHLMVLWRYLNS